MLRKGSRSRLTGMFWEAEVRRIRQRRMRRWVILYSQYLNIWINHHNTLPILLDDQ